MTIIYGGSISITIVQKTAQLPVIIGNYYYYYYYYYNYYYYCYIVITSDAGKSKL